MGYRDSNFYEKMFARWRRKNGGSIRSSVYEPTRGYKKTSNEATSTTGAKNNSGIWHLEEVHSAISTYVPTGEHVYNTPGTYSFTCPADITSVSVVCVGGGGGGMYYSTSNAAYMYPMNGGAGGGLGWKNNIPVTPGQTYTVVVGASGSSGVYSVGSTAGGTSYFLNTSTVSATGGQPGRYSTASIPGGTYTGDGGGIGGNSGATGSSGPCGGGGAAGYAGNGGRGGHRSQTALSGTGGAGGGGGWSTSFYESFGGGGVGLYGQASNGTAGAANTQAGGGSGGGISSSAQHGGAYGGGGGGNSSVYSGTGGNGGTGAVRIVWGDTRLFPSTNVDETSSGGNVTTN